MCIIGDIPIEEFERIKKEKGENLDKHYNINFLKKDNLIKYYQASDLLVLFTRGDVWG